MAEKKSYEERAEELELRISQLKQYRKDLIQRQRAADRKARTHRLIQNGGIIDSTFGCEVDPGVLAAYLATKVREDQEGNQITAGDIQRNFYLKTKERLEREKENQSEDTTEI